MPNPAFSSPTPNAAKIAVADLDGVLRGKYVSAEKYAQILEKGFGFCNVIFGWDMTDLCYDNAQVSGWHTGYPDALAWPDTSTQRAIPWESQLPLVLADFSKDESGAASVCPRSLLKRVVGKAAEMGYEAYFGAEYEWFSFRETPASVHEKGFQQLTPLSPGMFGYSMLRSSQHASYTDALLQQLPAFGIPLEGLHTETGTGVYEAAIAHSGALEAADRAVLFKQGVKEIAHRQGLLASFMAKWDSGMPGCSGHLHQSLKHTGTEQPVFAGPGRPNGFSRAFEHYLAGQMALLPILLPLLAPTVNSYKRLVEGSWAPVNMSWGIDNRTVALRAIPGAQPRVEVRLGGADANPYLAIAACLAAGLYGIENQLELEQPPVSGDAYQIKGLPALPRNLGDATARLKAAPLAGEWLGEAFISHFVRTREWEWAQYSQAVTNWELKRYFEII
ncbi:glutamine synthetase family protein [Phaeodactylibacter luteus]|uniref:glutamine synthetase family protein n=1 Tax=Phaeodactylibacter luteus TaxID=1564516 RepID=UPI001B885001|nr:glutamine synthetase family protein [Phaeodactylibacter luteus]